MQVTRPLAILAVSLSSLVGCSGSSTASLALMDAPPAGVTSVRIKVSSAQVHVDDKDDATNKGPDDTTVDDDGKWQTLTVNKTIDLVLHQGETAAEKLGELELPTGKITQLRLVLDTSVPANNVATLNGTDCNLDVTKVSTKGIKISHVFKAFDSKNGQKHQVWLDFDLENSMKVKGSCFELDPKLKLAKVKTDGQDIAL